MIYEENLDVRLEKVTWNDVPYDGTEAGVAHAMGDLGHATDLELTLVRGTKTNLASYATYNNGDTLIVISGIDAAGGRAKLQLFDLSEGTDVQIATARDGGVQTDFLELLNAVDEGKLEIWVPDLSGNGANQNPHID